MADLFNGNPEGFEFKEQSGESKKLSPLSARLAPNALEEFSGQEHLLGKGKPLRKLIEADNIRSAIFHGPPGSGKTGLARYIAKRTNAHVFELNAVTAGVGDIKKLLSQAKLYFSGHISGKPERTLIILDEIHHFNRTQQDVLLPSIESGEVILIGLTTENPSFYINNALISRFSVFEFKALSDDNLKEILNRAQQSPQLNLGSWQVEITEEAKKHFILQASGDARKLLNGLETALLITKANTEGKIIVDLEAAEASIQKKALRYDKKSDDHYDHISAFIKSMRGSDPDATVYWLAKMLAAGEDPRFIARRIFICACEDVGLADPVAMLVGEAAFKASEVLGMPEIRIPLAEAAVYIALAPKSNAAYLAIDKAMAAVENEPAREVPENLRSGSRGKGYVYPHDYPNHYVKQNYMPNPKKFYTAGPIGKEALLWERLKKIKNEL